MGAYEKWAYISLFLIILASSVNGQLKQSELPPELRAEDREIGNLLDRIAADTSTGASENANATLHQALTLCMTRKLRRDCALVHSAMGAAEIAASHFDEAKVQFQDSLEIAVNEGDLALQAEFLDSIANLTSVSGDPKRAIEIWTQALEAAKQAKSLYIQSEIDGNLARQHLVSADLKDAEEELNEALEIDELNKYALKNIHSVYKAYALIGKSEQNLQPALQLLVHARAAARASADWYTDALSTEAIALIYAHMGKLEEALTELSSVVHKKGAPLAQVIDLENTAAVFEMAGKTDEALQNWQELHDLGVSSHNDLIAFEANTHAASLLTRQKKFEQAVSKYKENLEIAVRRQNNVAVVQTLTSLTMLIQQHPETSSIAPLYEQLLSAIHEHSADNAEGTVLTFSTLVQLGNEYKRLKEFQKAEKAFRSAELLDPDSFSKLGNNPTQKAKLIELLHIQHAVVLDNLHDELGALLQAYRAFDSATKAEDKSAYGPIAFDINRWLNAEDPYARVQHFFANNDPWDALRLSESLFFEELWNEKWRLEHSEQAKQTFPGIATALDKMESSKNAQDLLDGNFYDIPPDLIGLRILVARKIAQLDLFRDGRPRDAEKFLGFIVKARGAAFQRPVFEAQCWMSIAAGLAGENSPSIAWANKCAASARNLDAAAERYANTIEWLARVSNFEVPGPEAITNVIELFGDKPEFRDKLARAYAAHGDFLSALGEANKAVQLFKAQGRWSEAANEAIYCSFLGRLLGPKGRTRKYAELARQLFTETSDQEGIAKVHLEESRLFGAENRLSDAMKAAEEARARSGQSITSTNAEASLWLAQLTAKTQPEKAVGLFNQAVEDAAAAKSTSLQSQALLGLSGDLSTLGRDSRALSVLKRAEELAKSSPGTLDGYSASEAAGRIYEKRGDMQAALAAYKRAEEAASAFPVQQGFALDAQAAVLEILGDWAGAEKSAQTALDLFKSRNYAAGEVWAIGELISIYSDRGSDLRDLKKAVDLYHTALGTDPTAQTSLGADMIEVYLRQGNYQQAVSEAEDGIKRCANDSLCEANLRVSLAEAYIGARNFNAASKQLHLAKSPIAKDGDAYLTGRFTYITGKLFFAQGQFRQSSKQFRAVCDLINRVGEESTDLGVGIRTNYSYIFEDLLSSLRAEFEKGDQLAAWTALDYADLEVSGTFDLRWRNLFIESLGAQLPPSIRDRERETSARVAELKQKLANVAEKGGSVLELQSALSTATRDREDLVKELRRVAPQYAAVAYPEPLNRDSLPLAPGEVLLRIHVGPTQIYEWLNIPTPNGPELRFYSFANDRQKLRALIAQVKAAFDQGRPDLLSTDTVHQIAAVVLPPEVSGVVRPASHLVYVPDDCLFLIPLEMLLGNGDSVPRTAVSYYPSVRDFVSSRAAKTSRHAWRQEFIGFADPITSPNDPRLSAIAVVNPAAETDPKVSREIARRGISLDRIPATAEEVTSIGKLFDAVHEKDEIYLGLDATKARVLHTDLSQFRYVHFATHGLLPGDAGIEEPALVLSRDLQSDDMLLSMSDVLHLKLTADLVVLSACNTGSGRLAKGEGVMNMGRAFMSAGASSVAMSLWQVSDVSTSILMHSLYQHLLAGVPKPKALALARQELFNAGYASPFFWAPFILVGD